MDDNIRILLRAAQAAPSADNCQPWHFSWDGKTLSIRYDTERVHKRTFPPESPATLLAIGAVIENISQAAEFCGLSLDIGPLQNTRDFPECYLRIGIADSENTNETTEEHPMFLRHTNRFGFAKEPVRGAAIETLGRLTEGNARIAVFEQRSAIKKIASSIYKASKVRFQTQEVHEWLGKSLRFSKQAVQQADGLDVRTLDLPPGGKHFLRFISDWDHMKALNKLGIYHLLARIDSRPVSQAPAVISFIAPSDPKSALDTGRLLTRAWIYLNSLGIAAHPYYVVSDQLDRLSKNLVPDHLHGQVETIKGGCEELFELNDGETLHMLLRIGYPTRKPPRSLRLPLQRVLTDLTKQ